MDKILLLCAYLVSTLVAVLFSLQLLGLNDTGYKGVFIGLSNGLSDFIVKEIIMSKTQFISGLHFITGTLTVFIISYLILGVNKRIAFAIPVLSYIVAMISEIMMLILLIVIFGKPLIDEMVSDIYIRSFIGLILQMPVFILFLLSKYKLNNFCIYEFKNYNRV